MRWGKKLQKWHKLNCISEAPTHVIFSFDWRLATAFFFYFWTSEIYDLEEISKLRKWIARYVSSVTFLFDWNISFKFISIFTRAREFCTTSTHCETSDAVISFDDVLLLLGQDDEMKNVSRADPIWGARWWRQITCFHQMGLITRFEVNRFGFRWTSVTALRQICKWNGTIHHVECRW